MNFLTSRLGWVLFVLENGDATMLVFERRINSFKFSWLAFKIVNNETSTCCAHNGHRIIHICHIASFADINCHNWIGWASIPKFKSFIPWSCHQGCVVGSLHPPDHFYRSLMLSYLHCLICGEVPAFDLFVTGGHENFASVIVPTNVKNWALRSKEWMRLQWYAISPRNYLHALHAFGNACSITLDFPASHIIVPGSGDKEWCVWDRRWRKSETRHRIVGRICHFSIFHGIWMISQPQTNTASASTAKAWWAKRTLAKHNSF